MASEKRNRQPRQPQPGSIKVSLLMRAILGKRPSVRAHRRGTASCSCVRSTEVNFDSTKVRRYGCKFMCRSRPAKLGSERRTSNSGLPKKDAKDAKRSSYPFSKNSKALSFCPRPT